MLNKVHEVNLDIFPVTIFFFRSSQEEAREIIHRAKGRITELVEGTGYDDICDTIQKCHGLTLSSKNRMTILIWLIDTASFGVLSHEISHSVDFIGDFIGEPIKGETRAYLHSHLFDTMSAMLLEEKDKNAEENRKKTKGRSGEKVSKRQGKAR